jgi:hypothetical protein
VSGGEQSDRRDSHLWLKIDVPLLAGYLFCKKGIGHRTESASEEAEKGVGQIEGFSLLIKGLK